MIDKSLDYKSELAFHKKMIVVMMRNSFRWVSSHTITSRNISSLIDVSQEVRNALYKNVPVVALETALVTHGMPFPENLKTALSAEEAIHSEGAIPATIGVIKGRVKVGISSEDLQMLAEGATPSVKVSRRDFPCVTSKRLNGGTTVAGTMVVADLVGIRVFSTGGVGGVHRGGQDTLDVSADLTELGRTPVAVVSSGVKAILDIPRTLEVLETQGVCVAVLGPPDANFPAFYCQGSSTKAPLCVGSPLEAAALLHSLLQLSLRSGMMLAVPVPSDHALEDATVERAVQQAEQEASTAGVHGKDLTPFLLRHITEATQGKALVANQALIVNNAKVGAQLAKEFCKLTSSK